MNPNILFSVYGGVFTCFNIGIASQAFSLMQCYDHPNGKRSLLSAPDVLCGSEVWQSLLGGAIPAIALFVVGYCCIISWAIREAPRAFHNQEFRQRWKFLFVKFRPSMWWWSLILFVKSLALSLTTVFFTISATQFVWLGFVMTSYTIFACALLPWRSLAVSVADSACHGIIVITFFELISQAPLGVLPTLTSVLPLAIVACLIAVLLQQQKSAAATRNTMLEKICNQTIILDAGSVSQLAVLPMLDIYTLQLAQGILAREIGGEMQSGSLQRLSSTTPGAKGTVAAKPLARVIDV